MLKGLLLTLCLLTVMMVLTPSVFASGRVITVTTVNNINPSAGSVSLLQALTGLQNGDRIHFNIPGNGPHFIETPSNGYTLITANNITIDGYSQPGSTPNTNHITGPNTAQIRIVLDSRNGNVRLLDFDPDANSSGYGTTEAAVLSFYGATNVAISGLSILSIPWYDNSEGQEVGVYGISFAKGATGHIHGNWIGVAPDGNTLAGPKCGVTGFRFRSLSADPYIMNDNVVMGVKVGSTNPQAEFNVFCGIPGIPVILEASGTRICGNFFNIYPAADRDFNPPLVDPENFFNTFEGNIEIGRSGNNTVIGVDGDGLNDVHERNAFSGVLPTSMGGYDHNIEFYSLNPGTNIVIAGNSFGAGFNVRFTNGVPALNASGNSAQYRFGTDFDGVSDEWEPNWVHNNWPTEMFPTSGFESFFSELSTGAVVNARNNILINNFAFPVSPLRDDSQFLLDYYAKALDVTAGVVPAIWSDSVGPHLIGTVPVANQDYPFTIIDLYEVDSAGMIYGQTAERPEMPHGYVQSGYYLGSFVDNSAADRNAAAGQFNFDISRTIAFGRLVTITATYSKSPPGARNPIATTSPFSDPFRLNNYTSIQMSVSKSGGDIGLSWQGGQGPFDVWKKRSLTDASWSIVTNNTTARFMWIAPADAHGFFRIQSLRYQ